MKNVEFTFLDNDGNSCAPSEMLKEIQEEAFKDFIFRINQKVQRIAVTSLAPGRSGATTFLVRRVTDSHALSPIVIKSSSKSNLIINERKNYETHVKDKLQHAPILIASDSFTLAYEYAKGLFERPTSLNEGYSAMNSTTLTTLIQKIVPVLWNWYKEFPHEISNIEDMNFSPPLGEMIKSLGPNFARYKFLEQWWIQFKRLRRSASPSTLYRSHGDLNIGNVMFDLASNDPVPLLIDFGSIRNAITYWDYAKLERDLKTRAFLREALNSKLKMESIVEVIRNVDLSHPKQSASLNRFALPPQKKIEECISAFRSEIVRQTSENLFNQAYFETLAYSTLTVLYRDNPDPKIPLETQKIIACESAAVILSKILQMTLPESVISTPSQKTLNFLETKLDGAVSYIDLTHSMYLNLVGERIRATPYGDIRYLAVAGWEVFRSVQILKALEDSSDLMQSKTLRIYLLKPDTEAFKEFVRLSNEPADMLIEKIEKTKQSLLKLSKSNHHSRLRIKLYMYDAIPSLNLLETPEQYLLRPYLIGKAQGTFNVIGINKSNGQNGLPLMLSNYINDLTYRSEEKLLKWF